MFLSLPKMLLTQILDWHDFFFLCHSPFFALFITSFINFNDSIILHISIYTASKSNGIFQCENIFHTHPLILFQNKILLQKISFLLLSLLNLLLPKMLFLLNISRSHMCDSKLIIFRTSKGVRTRSVQL